MFQDVLITFLLSLSPFGEARIGIPYGELNGIPIIWTLVIALSANLLVFPFVYKGIQLANKHLWKYRSYRKRAISLSSISLVSAMLALAVAFGIAINQFRKFFTI